MQLLAKLPRQHPARRDVDGNRGRGGGRISGQTSRPAVRRATAGAAIVLAFVGVADIIVIVIVVVTAAAAAAACNRGDDSIQVERFGSLEECTRMQGGGARVWCAGAGCGWTLAGGYSGGGGCKNRKWVRGRPPSRHRRRGRLR